MSIHQLIEDLDLGALREICERQGYPLAADASERTLRATVLDDYQRDALSAAEIRSVADDRADRLAAANAIIAEQNRALALAAREIEKLGGSQVLIVALMRDARRQVRS